MRVPPELAAIRKLPENQTCANCLAHTPFGHSNVVVKYKSFVCSDCKSAHQAYSHRVKVRDSWNLGSFLPVSAWNPWVFR